jgi:SAM-dependent methyltransferase
VLDVGCGDGLIDRLISERRADVRIRGIDVAARSDACIPVELFDGANIPYPDGVMDVVMFVDVLHHTTDPEALLREALRVARQYVILKDHLREGWLAGPTLRVMDWVGNAPHGVDLPYNYWPEKRWRESFARLGVRPKRWIDRLGLYPAPASLLFDRSLHFVASLQSD